MLFATVTSSSWSQSAGSPPAGRTAVPLLNEIWDFASSAIYPADLAARFDERTRLSLVSRLQQDNDLPLADVLNPFLLSLAVSHTRFFDTRHHGYYMLRSLFATRDLDSPALYLIGVQLDDRRLGRVRGVLDGLPASLAGIQVGDRIVSVNGASFESLLQWQTSEAVSIVVETGELQRELTIEPTRSGLHRAMVDATRASIRRYECDDTSVVYVHLWSGTDALFLQALSDAVAQSDPFDAFVLDLRDGYGGAWWPYLDPFFEDRSSYFEAVSFNRDGRSDVMRAEPAVNQARFKGPMAVLINAGTRSGKESLAWQFKKTGRARLFGTKTEGAFTAGRGVFADREAPYLLYLSVAEFQLDGQRIEGVGVAPDIEVFRKGAVDTPLLAALQYLNCPIDGRA